MNRRELTAALGAVPLAWAADGAEVPRMMCVGVLAPGPLRPIVSFKQRLSELGWVESRNIRYEDRWAGGDDTRYDALAAALVNDPADRPVTAKWTLQKADFGPTDRRAKRKSVLGPTRWSEGRHVVHAPTGRSEAGFAPTRLEGLLRATEQLTLRHLFFIPLL